jgi:uroporphyrinogen decarboxylase
MTSRERVETALRHEEPDYVPVDIWGSASRINTELYQKLAAMFGLHDTGRLIRPGSDTQYEDYALADILGSDFRHINIGRAAGYKPYKDENGYIIDEFGVGRSLVGMYPTIVKNPLADADIEELKDYQTPKAEDPGRIAGIGELAKYYYEQTDKYVTATPAQSGQIFDVCQYLRGTENFLVDLCADEDFARLLIEKVTDYLVRLNLYYLEPIAPYIGWVEFTSDFGAQHGPFISCKMFRDFFKEPYTRLYSAVKTKYPHLKIFMHSCGSVADLIEEFIECGVDVMNPIQPLAKGMDSAAMKARYGDRVTFHGAIDIQNAINGTTEEVEAEAKKRIQALGHGGGYILSAANHIQRNAPPENVVTLFRAAKKYGKYPLE